MPQNDIREMSAKLAFWLSYFAIMSAIAWVGIIRPLLTYWAVLSILPI